MLEKLKDKDNSTVYLTVVKKLLLKTESTAFTKASVFQLLVFSPTEHSISGNYKDYFRGYDAGKRFIWGNEQ